MFDECERERVEPRRRLLTSLFSSIFLVWMIETVQDQVVAGDATGVALVLGYMFCYPFGIWLSFGLRLWPKVVLIAVMYQLAAAMVVHLGPSSAGALVYVVALSAAILPQAAGITVGLLGTAAAFAVSFYQQGGPSYGSLALMLALTIGLSLFAKQGNNLKKANEEVARLAVAEERARVARDIHDVLGHSLTTVTVKLGLVRRLLETTPGEVERLIVEVGEAEQLSRQALSEVRATLSGYRSASLTAEVAGARAALASAGIAADLPRAVDNVTPAYQESFAYVLREGVTNVLRHSGATTCEVRLGESWLEVRDNGHACTSTASSSRANGGGEGLTGLADRMAAIGGQLDAGPVPGGGFLLRASVPA